MHRADELFSWFLVLFRFSCLHEAFQTLSLFAAMIKPATAHVAPWLSMDTADNWERNSHASSNSNPWGILASPCN